jgi:hypothetical protein
MLLPKSIPGLEAQVDAAIAQDDSIAQVVYNAAIEAAFEEGSRRAHLYHAPWPQRFVCPEHGFTAADEDGCCSACGADCAVVESFPDHDISRTLGRPNDPPAALDVKQMKGTPLTFKAVEEGARALKRQLRVEGVPVVAPTYPQDRQYAPIGPGGWRQLSATVLVPHDCTCNELPGDDPTCTEHAS